MTCNSSSISASSMSGHTSRHRRSVSYGRDDHKCGFRFTQIQVNNLDEDYYTEDKVKILFARFGIVEDVRLLRDIVGRSLGQALVTFTEHFMAVRACQWLNGFHCERHTLGKTLDVRPVSSVAADDHSRVISVGTSKARIFRLLVDNLDREVDDKRLLKEFARFGTLATCMVIRDEWSRNTCGLGLIGYLREEDANRAVQAICKGQGMIIEGKALTVQEFIPFSERKTSERLLYVNGAHDLNEVLHLFGNCDDVEGVEKIGDKKWCVTFRNIAAANTALSKVRVIRAFTVNDQFTYRMKLDSISLLLEFKCKICLKTKSIDYLIGFGCGHHFCWQCVRTHVESSIKDRTYAMMCPEANCSRLATEELIKVLVSEHLYFRYLEMSRNMSAKYTDVIRDNLSEMFINKTCKKCPFCGIPIQKIDGCSSMHCTACSNNFSWDTLDLYYPPHSPPDYASDYSSCM